MPAKKDSVFFSRALELAKLAQRVIMVVLTVGLIYVMYLGVVEMRGMKDEIHETNTQLGVLVNRTAGMETAVLGLSATIENNWIYRLFK